MGTAYRSRATIGWIAGACGGCVREATLLVSTSLPRSHFGAALTLGAEMPHVLINIAPSRSICCTAPPIVVTIQDSRYQGSFKI